MREEDLDSSDDDRPQPDAYYTDDDSSTVDAALEAREVVIACLNRHRCLIHHRS